MQIFRDYQALHAIPEQGWQLPRTLAYVEKSLDGRAFSPMPGALAAYFDFGRGSAIAFRAELDALPGGHLCGHDGHTAILLELARCLAGAAGLPHNVLLLFQPAEETTGGAEELCETGILEEYGVEALFGLHIWPGLPAGRLYTRVGPVMAGAVQVDVEVSGEAGHIASPGPDALGAAEAFYRRARWESGEGFCRFGLFQAGTAGNVRAETARLQGSLRSFSGELLKRKRELLWKIAREVTAESGCEVLCKLSRGYAPVHNPARLAEQAGQAVEFGELPGRSWMAEDFSAYQARVPGLFFFLGAGDGPQLHSPDFRFPLSILPRAAAFWQKLAERL